jgi:hypothetical protein
LVRKGRVQVSYSQLVALVALRNVSSTFVADVVEILGANPSDDYADGSPITERCPVSPLAARERPIHVVG